jgi:hypothetical protein
MFIASCMIWYGGNLEHSQRHRGRPVSYSRGRDSNQIGPEIGYVDQDSTLNQATTASFHILSKSLFINRRYIVRVADSVVK